VCGVILGPSVGARIHFRTHRIPVPTVAYLLKASAVTTVGVLALSGLMALCGVTALLEMGVLAACSLTVLRRFSPCTDVPPITRGHWCGHPRPACTVLSLTE